MPVKKDVQQTETTLPQLPTEQELQQLINPLIDPLAFAYIEEHLPSQVKARIQQLVTNPTESDYQAMQAIFERVGLIVAVATLRDSLRALRQGSSTQTVPALEASKQPLQAANNS